VLSRKGFFVSVSCGMANIAPATAACIRKIRATLPPEAFQPARERLWHFGLHAGVLAAGYLAIAAWPAAGPVFALVIGHSLACLAFVAHEISHNAVVRNRPAKYALTLASLGINMVPPTMWNRLHNDAHHGHANTPDDPDRPFIAGEENAATNVYSAVTMPSQDTWRGNGLIFVHFVTYIARHIVTVFYAPDAKPAIVTRRPDYRLHERQTIVIELAVIAAMQYGVWILSGRSAVNYLWASPVSLCVASGVIMAYVFTNHFLNPISHEHDPLAGSTSVRVPRLVDRLHGHFSFHTEHHLFPTLNSDYYPLVSAALKEEAAGEYRQLEFSEAWRQLWLQPRFRAIAQPACPPEPWRRPEVSSPSTLRRP
jgi:fatty acid desaturase